MESPALSLHVGSWPSAASAARKYVPDPWPPGPVRIDEGRWYSLQDSKRTRRPEPTGKIRKVIR